MKVYKRIAVAFLASLLVLMLTSCGLTDSLKDFSDQFADPVTPKGKDYITYTNSKRDEVTKVFAGDKVDGEAAVLLFDNIELTYYETEDQENVYEIIVDNANRNYMYDGVINFIDGDNSFYINVDMLAPDNYEYFLLTIEGEPEDCEYVVEGDLYEWNEEFIIDYEYEEQVSDYSYYEALVIVYEDSLSEAMLRAFGEHYYYYDTLYNYDAAITYFFVTFDNYDPNDFSVYDYELLVDTENQKMEAWDIEGNEIFTWDF